MRPLWRRRLALVLRSNVWFCVDCPIEVNFINCVASGYIPRLWKCFRFCVSILCKEIVRHYQNTLPLTPSSISLMNAKIFWVRQNWRKVKKPPLGPFKHQKNEEMCIRFALNFLTAFWTAAFSVLSIFSCCLVFAFLNNVITTVVTGTTKSVLQKLVHNWSGDKLKIYFAQRWT